MALSKEVKSIVICIIAAFVGVMELLLIFVDFGLGAQTPHIWAQIIPGFFIIIGIAIVAYLIIESQNGS